MVKLAVVLVRIWLRLKVLLSTITLTNLEKLFNERIHGAYGIYRPCGSTELIRPQLDLAISRVLDHGQYIMGPEVKELEGQLWRVYWGELCTYLC